MMTHGQKIGLFGKEIGLIKNGEIREFVKEVFKHIPDHGFTIAASTTGKYHLPDENEYMGNVVHSKRVVKWVLLMARAYEITEQSDIDILIAAAILHDLGKAGFKEKGSIHTLSNHSSLMMAPIERAAKSVGLCTDIKDKIKKCVLYHNGIWTEKAYNKPRSEYTDLEWCLHMADYATSKMRDLL
jgi:23S rRNA maturation-related 3'-5' exoribonuclease YhaM